MQVGAQTNASDVISQIEKTINVIITNLKRGEILTSKPLKAC